MPLLTLLAITALACLGLLLAVACWRRRAALAMLCALGGSMAAVYAPFRHPPSLALAGSLAASAIGAILLGLGQAMKYLLDGEPRGV